MAQSDILYTRRPRTDLLITIQRSAKKLDSIPLEQPFTYLTPTRADRLVLLTPKKLVHYGMREQDTETISLDPRYSETSFEHDRLYQTYSLDEAIYCVPVDEDEEDRLEIQHEVLKRFFGGKLFFGIGIPSPRKVLDCGYGLATWAVEVAQKYPDCEVTGLDMYSFDLPDLPDNVTLDCDDLNKDLTEIYPRGEFDVIQSRLVGPGIHRDRWLIYIQELLGLLKPGGYLQMMEYYFNFQSHSGLLGQDDALYEWGLKYRQATERDRNPRIGSMGSLADLMRTAGLCDVQYQNCSLPIGPWSRDEREKEIGRMNLANFDKMLDSYGTWPFIHRLGMTLEEVHSLNERARAEARNPRYKTYIPLTVAWARKPVRL